MTEQFAEVLTRAADARHDKVKERWRDRLTLFTLPRSSSQYDPQRVFDMLAVHGREVMKLSYELDVMTPALTAVENGEDDAVAYHRLARELAREERALSRQVASDAYAVAVTELMREAVAELTAELLEPFRGIQPTAT